MQDLDQIRAEVEAENRSHDELLKTLEVPEYTERVLHAQWVKHKTEHAVTGTTGLTASAPAEVLERLNDGDPYILETKGFNLVSGWLIGGQWYARKSDQDLQREHDAYFEKSTQERAAHLAANRADWERREAELPAWLRDRLREIRTKNDDFAAEPMGWGYELTVSELTVLYLNLGTRILGKSPYRITDSDEISAFADKHGTTGFQHSVAVSWAQNHLQTKIDTGRHFAGYGSPGTTCGLKVPTAPDEKSGDYLDDRFTTQRARTTCPACQEHMTGPGIGEQP